MRYISHYPGMSGQRFWKLVSFSATPTLVVILFFSGAWQLENILTKLPPTQVNPVAQTASVDAADVANLTNQNRIQNGLPALAVSPLLTQAAQDKANDMAANSYYAHISPDGKSPLYWLDLVGYKYLNAGENLVIDRTTSEQAVDAWMQSEHHRENILRPQFTEIGVGVAEGTYEGRQTIFVVQEFGTPYPTELHPTVFRQLIQPIVQPFKTIVVQKKKPATPMATIATTTTANSLVASSTVPTIAFTLPPEFYRSVQLITVSTSTNSITSEYASSSFEMPEMHHMPSWLTESISYVRSVFDKVRL